MTGKHMELDADELAAIKDFAKQYGREWKAYLSAAWLSHAYKGKHMGGADRGILRSIRNNYGHAWLRNYQLPTEPKLV